MKKYNITVNGNLYEVEVEEVTATTSAPVTPASVAPKATPKAAPATTKPAGSVPVTAPMPGTILEVKTTIGATVKRGDTLFILEAMKMENEIPAPQDGVVASIDIAKGASVSTGTVLASLK